MILQRENTLYIFKNLFYNYERTTASGQGESMFRFSL